MGRRKLEKNIETILTFYQSTQSHGDIRRCLCITLLYRIEFYSISCKVWPDKQMKTDFNSRRNFYFLNSLPGMNFAPCEQLKMQWKLTFGNTLYFIWAGHKIFINYIAQVAVIHIRVVLRIENYSIPWWKLTQIYK